MTQSSDPSNDRRIDVYRRGHQFMCIARSAEAGSLGLLFEGILDPKDRDLLGQKALEWLQNARELEPPGSKFQYPEHLLPTGWDVIRWHSFMSEASLCAVAPVSPERLNLRPYKNLHPVGEEFSHEGSHSLDSPPRANALASALRAALDVAQSISQVRRSQSSAYLGETELIASVGAGFQRLGARLFQRPPHTETLEIGEGFFLLPTSLRQLIFDVVWRRGTHVTDSLDRRWEVSWMPVSTEPRYRAFPLFSLFRSDESELMIRLDSPNPCDPEVYRLNASHRDDPQSVLGPAAGPPPQGPSLSMVLETLEPDQ